METETQTKTETKSASKRKILLVDDNEIIRIYFRDVFWIHGLEDKYELIISENIEKAEDLIKDPKTRPAIVFSGLVMPFKEGDKTVVTADAGFYLLEKIKSDPLLKKIIVVIFSGYDDKKYQDKAKKLGADYFLVKHENMPRELVQFIENLSLK